jgi:prepilin-type N-terminal cleavage/methylation domain-containing protein
VKSKNKKRGFTIIELIIVLGMVSILLSITLINFGGYNKLKNKVDVDVFSNSLINLVNNSKEYCRDNNIGGYLYFDTEKSVIYLNCGLQQVYKLQSPDKFKLNIVRPGNKIKIDNRGITEDACTIQYKDRENEIHCITMCVGTAFVEFKY